MRDYALRPVTRDYGRVRLGKRAPKVDRRTLRLGRYLGPELAEPAPAVNWFGDRKDWGMLLNDQLGDCTIAAALHAVEVWGAAVDADPPVSFADAVAQRYYQLWDGYVPGDPATDGGGVELDVLNAWRKAKLAGHALLGYADPDAANATHVRQAIALFGTLYLGLNLPLTANQQLNEGKPWDVVGDGRTGNAAPGSWGGHAVTAAAYDFSPGLTHPTVSVATWDLVWPMTWRFFAAYVDEAHALVGGMWFKRGPAPSGFRLGAFQQDLAGVTG